MKNLKIGTKLMLMVGVPLIAVLFLAIQGSRLLEQTYTELTDAYYETLYKSNSLLLNADRDMYQARLAQNRLELGRLTQVERERYQIEVKENLDQINERMTEALEIIKPLGPFMVDIRNKETGKNVFEYEESFKANYKIWVNNFDAETGKVASQRDLDKAFETARADLDGIGGIMEDLAQGAQNAMKESIDASAIGFASTGLFVGVIAIVLAFMITRDSKKMLQKVQELSARLANYNFSEDMNINRKDEYGQTIHTLNDAQKNIRQFVGILIGKIQEIDKSSEVLAVAMGKMNQSFEEMETSTETIYSNVEENSALSEEIAASVEEVNTSIEVLAKESTNGMNESIQIKERATKIATSSEEAITTTQTLYKEKENLILAAVEEGKVVSEITKMADSVENIANQINLLALNAAIEAARAGEAGKGFAVVADEVRKLAEDSSQSVKNVRGVISKTQHAFENLSSNSSALLKFMQEDVQKQFNEFLNVGNQYENDADFVGTMSTTLASMTQEINATTEQVADAIAHMAAMAQTSSEGSKMIKEQIESSSESMDQIEEIATGQRSLATELRTLTDRFKI